MRRREFIATLGSRHQGLIDVSQYPDRGYRLRRRRVGRAGLAGIWRAAALRRIASCALAAMPP